MKNSKISVIIPIYNVEKYLRKCLNAIVNQTYKNLEIILVDDESPDNCSKICEEYAKKDERIIVIHKKNGGQASARNRGLDIATGDYISFIDPDDYIEKDFYEHLITLASEHNADIAECSFKKLYENTGKIEKVFKKENEIVVTDNEGALNRLFSEKFNVYLNTIVTWNKIYKRKLFKKIRFSEVRIYEELGTVYKVLFECKTFVTSSKIKYTYVQRDGSTLTRPFSEERLYMLDGIEQAINFLQKKGLYDIRIKAIRKYLETCTRFIKMSASMEEKEREVLRQKINAKFYTMHDELSKMLKKQSEMLLGSLLQDFQEDQNKIGKAVI